MNAAEIVDPNDTKNSLTYGLNPRKKRNKTGGLTGFFDDDNDDDDDENTPSTGKRATNRDIAREQASLRQRAQTAASKLDDDADIFDYDAQYESFASGGAAATRETKRANETRATAGGGDDDKRSRYVANLLRHAERRTREQEIVYERKVARERVLEEGARGELYEGKETFITGAYKRKLAERERWAREEEEKAKREEEEDVAAKARKEGKGGGRFLLYGGGVGRNGVLGGTARGGGTKEEEEGDRAGDVVDERGKDWGNEVGRNDGDNRAQFDSGNLEYRQRDSSRETERRGSSRRNKEVRDNFRSESYSKHDDAVVQKNNGHEKVEEEVENKNKTRQEILAERAIKIGEARKRYFQRHGGIPTQ
ncbi:hypothetical protein ACHAXS_011373 [Conticribra weissflogii]